MQTNQGGSNWKELLYQFSYFLIGSMIVNLINWNVDTCDADEVILWTPWNWDRIVPLNVMLGILYTVSTRVFFTREY